MQPEIPAGWRSTHSCMYNVPRTCKLMTAALKDLTRKAAHNLVVNLILSCRTCKRQESTSVGIDASVKNKWKVWRWLKEKVETGLCLARFASRRCVWVTASKRSMCRVRLSVPGVTRYGPINPNFVCSFVSSLLYIMLILASFVAEMKIENRGKKIVSVGKNR